ncbi:hypothetical protein SDC9_208175 [bioreactor metagenome]|uniref:Glycosyl hydrolase family 38 C-terminal domain-containing protein n=1 Tax=bioreactor metagenome TaxID=1076179 RepID=A0A645JAL7_9ZZZZ
MIKATTTYNRSTLSQYYTLYKDSKKLDIRCKLNFNEHYKIAKLSFPINIKNPKAIYSMPFGFIEKEPNGQEEPAHGWIDVKDENAWVLHSSMIQNTVFLSKTMKCA